MGRDRIATLSSRAIAAGLGLAALSLTAAPGQATASSAPPSPLCNRRTAPAPAALSVVSWTDTGHDPRLRDYTLASSALGTAHSAARVHVEVLLPPGYDPANRAAHYPVLYLLHGHGGSYLDWANHGVEHIIDAVNPHVIVVMPDGGYDGFYSDWYGTDVDGHNGTFPPGWETFHIDELLPWVDSTFDVVATRAGRAIAGLSMGGFGSMSYSARHPDLFSVAGAFSGADDSDLDYPVGSQAQALASNLPDQKPPDDCIWGDPITEDVVWRTHDPTELAPNLSDTSLLLWSGNGQPGDATPGAPAWNPSAGLTEEGIYQENQGFVAALGVAGERPFVDFYGPGIHDWFYWDRDLRQFLTRLPTDFWSGAGPANRPPVTGFTYQSAEPTFRVWGWTFTSHRDVQEFTYLSGVTPDGFTVRGSGRLSVTMPAAYVPGTRVAVTNNVTHAAAGATASKDPTTGRTTFTIDLGPSHQTQQYLFGPTGETATFPTSYAVRIDQPAAPATLDRPPPSSSSPSGPSPPSPPGGNARTTVSSALPNTGGRTGLVPGAVLLVLAGWAWRAAGDRRRTGQQH